MLRSRYVMVGSPRDVNRGGSFAGNQASAAVRGLEGNIGITIERSEWGQSS